jgi:AraC-like DNA-binding protein
MRTMDRSLRSWWTLADRLPAELRAVALWPAGSPLPGDLAYGQLHPCPTAVACLTGVVRVGGAGGVLDLHPGEALVVGAGVWHAHHPVRPGGAWAAIGFLPGCAMLTLGDHAGHWDGRLARAPLREALARVEHAEDPARRLRAFRDLAALAVAGDVPALDLGPPPVRAMVRRLWAGWHRGITTAAVLAASGLGRSQAYRAFTAWYGLPPKLALEATRLELAEALLAAGLPVQETAYRCGYRAAAGFSRATTARRRRAPPPPRGAAASGRDTAGPAPADIRPSGAHGR